MRAEVFSHSREIATKHDLEVMRTSMLRWMIALFLPVWAGTWATVVAVILKA